MAQHEWGDTDFDWEALDEAGYYIQDRCRQFARLGVHTKGKYGTLRVSVYFWNYWPIHSLVKPGHLYYRWSNWMIKYIEFPLGWFFSKIGLTKLVNKYQTAVLKYFWKRAAKKWPQVAEEILDEYDWMIND